MSFFSLILYFPITFQKHNRYDLKINNQNRVNDILLVLMVCGRLICLGDIYRRGYMSEGAAIWGVHCPGGKCPGAKCQREKGGGVMSLNQPTVFSKYNKYLIYWSLQMSDYFTPCYNKTSHNHQISSFM